MGGACAACSNLGGMNETIPTNLIAEAERYLAAVAVFRAEGSEPHWRPEPGARRRRSSRLLPVKGDAPAAAPQS